MTNRAEWRYSVPDHVMFRELDGESVLLDLQSEVYLGLDQVGTRFWILLNKDGSVAIALEALLKEFDVTRDRLEKDVSDLILELVARGLLETVEE